MERTYSSDESEAVDKTFIISRKASPAPDEGLSHPQLKLDFSESEDDRGQDEATSSKSTSKKTAASSDVKSLRLTFSDMIVKAVGDNNNSKGVSVPAIKTYIASHYAVDETKMKAHLKKALEKCLASKQIVRCQVKGTKEMTGLVGRFKLNSNHKETERKSKGQKSAKPEKKTAQPQRKQLTKIKAEQLKSLKQTSAVSKMAQSKVKQARMSLSRRISKEVAEKKNTEQPVRTSKKQRSKKNLAAKTGKPSASKKGNVFPRASADPLQNPKSTSAPRKKDETTKSSKPSKSTGKKTTKKTIETKKDSGGKGRPKK